MYYMLRMYRGDPLNIQLLWFDSINSVKAETCLPVVLYPSPELLRGCSMEDNEAASGEVMLNKWDPLLALVKCQ